MNKDVPNQEPERIGYYVGNDHNLHAKGAEEQEQDELHQTEADGVPHVHLALALTDKEIAIKGGEGHEGTAHAEYLHEFGTGQPFLGYRDDNKFGGNQGEAEEGGHTQEGRQAQHLAEDALFALHLGIGEAREEGLGDAPYHPREEGVAHTCPFVGLIEVAHGLLTVEAAEEDTEEVVVDVHEDVRDEQPRTETNHPAQRAQVDMPSRVPFAVPPTAEGHQQAVGKVLNGDAPIGKAVPSQRHACHTARHQGYNGDNGRFADAHIAEEPGAHGGAHRRDDETEEDQSREGHEHGRAKPHGYQWRTAEEQGVDAQRHENVEPKHGVEVGIRSFLLAVERTDEAALLQGIGYEREDGEHPHDTIVFGCEQARQEDAEDEVEQLLAALTDTSPKEAIGGFGFQ